MYRISDSPNFTHSFNFAYSTKSRAVRTFLYRGDSRNENVLASSSINVPKSFTPADVKRKYYLLKAVIKGNTPEYNSYLKDINRKFPGSKGESRDWGFSIPDTDLISCEVIEEYKNLEDLCIKNGITLKDASSSSSGMNYRDLITYAETIAKRYWGAVNWNKEDIKEFISNQEDTITIITRYWDDDLRNGTPEDDIINAMNAFEDKTKSATKDLQKKFPKWKFDTDGDKWTTLITLETI